MTSVQPTNSDDCEPIQPLACPKCATLMRRITVGAVEVDRCDGCGGIWLDALEKEQILAQKGSAAALDSGTISNPHTAAQNRKQHIKCPRDHAQMIHMVDIRQPHIGYESCNTCGGVYLDAGELKDLSEYTLRERLGFGRKQV